jgi:hypothetical protein
MSMIGCYVSLSAADLAKLEQNPEYLDELLEGDGRPVTEIEKSWQAIHFVLNGDPWRGSGPLNNVVMGGKEVGDDLGYGPARILSADGVKQTAGALGGLTAGQFAQKGAACGFASAEIYVYSDEDPTDQDIVEELTDYFEELKVFFREAAQRGDGMLLYIG